jgi:Holliday junction DNA helicase RuvA
MYYYLDGNVSLVSQNLAVIDISGAGYACRVTMNTLKNLEVGKKARLYTFCYIKEDAFDIYGFYELTEKRCFELLLSVSGVGPKAALSILSSATPESLALAIINEDDTALTIAQGIGKKIAVRIIVEL